MKNQTQTSKYDYMHRMISFNFLANQPTTSYSVGTWSLHPVIPPSNFFVVPRDKRLELVEIRKTDKSHIDLFFSYIKNLSFNKIKLELNNENKVVTLKKPITFGPLDQVQFIAYPATSPSKGITEEVTVLFHLFHIRQGRKQDVQ